MVKHSWMQVLGPPSRTINILLNDSDSHIDGLSYSLRVSTLYVNFRGLYTVVRVADVWNARDKVLSVDGHGHTSFHIDGERAQRKSCLRHVRRSRGSRNTRSRTHLCKPSSVEERVSQMLHDLGISLQVFCLLEPELTFGREFTPEAVFVIWDGLLVSAALVLGDSEQASARLLPEMQQPVFYGQCCCHSISWGTV